MNDPPTDIQVPNLKLKENSVENILISQVTVIDQDGNVKGCDLRDDAGGRVKLVGLNLVAGPISTNYEALGASKTLDIELKCSDTDGKSVSKSFKIDVSGKSNFAIIFLTLASLFYCVYVYMYVYVCVCMYMFI